VHVKTKQSLLEHLRENLLLNSTPVQQEFYSSIRLVFNLR